MDLKWQGESLGINVVGKNYLNLRVVGKTLEIIVVGTI